MNSSTSFQKYPDTWLKVAIGIGLLGLFLMVSIPALLAAVYGNEVQRFTECEQYLRTDCQPSLLWVWNDWTLGKQGSPPNTLSSATSTTDGRSRRSSLTAPRILLASLDGMNLEGDTYRAAPGTVVNATVQVADAKTVSLYLIPKATEGAGLPKRLVILKKAADGSYVGTWKVEAGLLADLEVRATGNDNETASLLLKVAAK